MTMKRVRSYAYALGRKMEHLAKVMFIVASNFTLKWHDVDLSPGFDEFVKTMIKNMPECITMSVDDEEMRADELMVESFASGFGDINMAHEPLPVRPDAAVAPNPGFLSAPAHDAPLVLNASSSSPRAILTGDLGSPFHLSAFSTPSASAYNPMPPAPSLPDGSTPVPPAPSMVSGGMWGMPVANLVHEARVLMQQAHHFHRQAMMTQHAAMAKQAAIFAAMAKQADMFATAAAFYH
jgi:hypothetical protein